MALENLQNAIDNLEQLIEAQTASWLEAGAPPTFSIDGESYDWNNWLSGKLDAIERIREQIGRASGPFIVRSRVRA